MDWRKTWVDALDALEADVDAVEQMIKDEHGRRDLPAGTPWHPPAGLATLPLDLRRRADAILARQVDVARKLSAAITTNRRQTAFAARVEVGTPGKAVASYVDKAV
ncbi:MAG: hypothetical protein QOH97_4065 [Actinoplanes sp.]|jgi:hypothetical protein|nr:hypothetical protein [Actinoplanes sp.]MDX6521345.1 hypothetical protein [Gaiellales bacterium]